jgi:hypothetical protein
MMSIQVGIVFTLRLRRDKGYDYGSISKNGCLILHDNWRGISIGYYDRTYRRLPQRKETVGHSGYGRKGDRLG